MIDYRYIMMKAHHRMPNARKLVPNAHHIMTNAHEIIINAYHIITPQDEVPKYIFFHIPMYSFKNPTNCHKNTQD